VIVLLGGEAGLRCGEMIGLQWDDVDLVKTAAPRRAVGMARAHPCAEGRPLRYVPLRIRLAKAWRDHRHPRGPLCCARPTDPR